MKSFIKQFNFLKKVKTARLPLPQKQHILLERFFAMEHHQWIKTNTTLRYSFETLYQHFPETVVDFFLSGPPTLVLPTSGILACSLTSNTQENLIIVFPDLLKMLHSASPEHGIAVLAHEYGHLFYKHSRNKIGTLKAQLQADQFTFILGLGHELLDVLMDYPDQPDFKLRSYSLNQLLKN